MQNCTLNSKIAEIKKSGISKRRNPLIAQFFEKMGLMEQEGRGLTFMKNEAKKHGLPEPTIEAGSKTFKITFHNISEKSNGFMSSPYKTVRNYENLNERQKEVMEYLRKNPNLQISRSDYIRITKTQAKTATRDLTNLCKRKVLDKNGKGKGTRYRLFPLLMSNKYKI